MRLNQGEWVRIIKGLQEEAIQTTHQPGSGEDQGQARLSNQDTPDAEEITTGGLSGPAWQSLGEISRVEENLADILQGDFELRDGAEGLNDWMSFPEAGEDAPGEGHQDNLSAQVSLDEMIFPDSQEDYPVSDVTFYLVPRQDDDFILGELAHGLRVWLVDICQYYAWQLDSLRVRPNYLRWTLCDFPHLLTQEMLQIVRQETSQRIFRLFPQLQRGGQHVEYWASGYLMDLENREFSTQMLMAHLTRSSSRVAGNVPHSFEFS